MSTPWPAVAPDELDDHIRGLERVAYARFDLEADEEIIPVATPAGHFDVRVLHVNRDADTQPPVFLLHGVGSFSALAVEMAAYLRDRHIVILDWPGHGLSGPCAIPGPGVLRTFAVSVFQGVLDELGLPVVDVVAHSLGGQFSLYAAIDIPRRIRRLALVGCPGAGLKGGKPIPPMLVMAMPFVGKRLMSTQITAERFERFNAMAIGPGAGAHLPEEVHMIGFYMANRPDYGPSVSTYFRALIQGRGLRAMHNVPIADLERITAPTLFAWGDKDTFHTPTNAAESIVAFRDHRLLRLPHAGHAPWLDEPELVGRALVAHLSD
ncbi:MAG: alpha/beta hydrolase [Tetrasphaera sp.]